MGHVYSTLYIQPWILNTGYSALDIQLWIFNPGYSALDIQHWIFSTGYSALDIQLWIFSPGYSALDIQLWIFSLQSLCRGSYVFLLVPHTKRLRKDRCCLPRSRTNAFLTVFLQSWFCPFCYFNHKYL